MFSSMYFYSCDLASVQLPYIPQQPSRKPIELQTYVTVLGSNDCGRILLQWQKRRLDWVKFSENTYFFRNFP